MITLNEEDLSIRVEYKVDWEDCAELYDDIIEDGYEYNDSPASDELTKEQKLEILTRIKKVYEEENKYASLGDCIRDIWDCRTDGIMEWLYHYGEKK